MKNAIFILTSIMLLISCSKNRNKSDAYGSFEAEEYTISAEVAGKLLDFTAEEGQVYSKGQVVGHIDSIDLVLKREQLKALKSAASSKTGNVASQIGVQNQQKENLLIEKNRFEKLLKDGAATEKQMDDLKASIRLIEKQIKLIESQGTAIPDELESYNKQVEMVNASLRKCIIVNPVTGTVLTRYAMENEFASAGRALYKIADLNTMYLRVYISGDQLAHVKLGQKVKVLIDESKKTYRTLEGVVSWISPTGEFTPKIIQTKEQRVALVYAMKIKVINDGSLKINMPGEVVFK
jgi:HlyD family secretion protein